MTTHPFEENQGRLLAGRYLLGEPLGRGGMGVVWSARDQLLDRDVAVKELQVSAVPEAELHTLYTRMQQEARAAARIDHPSVVTVHDVVEQDGRPWIVMELVDGQSLAEIITREGTLLPRDAARVGAQVASALVQAHRQGVLHRDVKPANVMIDRRGRAVLTDFGIARFEGAGGLTRTGEIVGSPDYLSPERVAGHRPGPESDLWALGATLYAAVEGQSPFLRNTTIGTLNAVMSDPLPEPVHAGPLAPVIAALMDKDPTQRVTGDEAVHLLEEVARGRTPPTPTVAAMPPAPQNAATPQPSTATAPTLPVQPPVPPLGGVGPSPPRSPGPRSPGNAGYGSGAGGWPAGPGPYGGPPPSPSTSPTPPTPPPDWPGPTAPDEQRRRRRGLVIAGAALAALLVGGGAAAAVLVTQSHTGSTAATSTAPATHGVAPTPTPTSTPTPTTASPGASAATQPAPPPAVATPGPAQVVTSYYDAINAHDYTTAWNLGGKNLGGSFSSFSSGFADTATDTVTVDNVSGDTAFVHLHAVHNDGSTSDFSGSYTVQNGVITGASIRQLP